MISSLLSNRIIFVLSLLGLSLSSFLLYEYNFSGYIVCPVGAGCDIVRASPYSRFFGISIPILGVVFYLTMAALSILRSYVFFERKAFILQLSGAVAGVGFGIYLTLLEIFVIRAICFWCVLSFIISIVILLSVLLTRKDHYDNRN